MEKRDKAYFLGRLLQIKSQRRAKMEQAVLVSSWSINNFAFVDVFTLPTSIKADSCMVLIKL